MNIYIFKGDRYDYDCFPFDTLWCLLIHTDPMIYQYTLIIRMV